ncbi:hypothetical protein COU78_00810 [Candidatus Peregrinibacteria bacterium CG10_big_fil_rev_8_21_14_0_10_49_24]|nr:MAG: hypothetical protein COV83_01060 [Candidatus Peregrinibacteria bacterium CG11_big_fil_rev_8_21_14_0_20_49_14]PIR51492.1 MAG: hypothetical protein COU78_00810 [Candidatus Peregrinibacteria bacterium CG10_big_fil_rev_8_21_14_0_10_49_24]PJA67865.1 MAG: hypothetical protein CO157_02530 [Candidatus Peregrinibacteria bacterium CG_4_9_14_3_um_filter_49_12]
MAKKESEHRRDVHSMTPEQFGEIDRIAAEFDGKNKNGESPRIRDFLQSDILDRRVLLRELVLCDASHRYTQGQEPSMDDYTAQFPELEGDTVLLDELKTLR